ncbi:unnamed protein product [Euphydryas editha]|uniref:Uncharacterized protein n=1 Tax=Euphydryas editha TaxID=104508 RepID=A0AAU9V439_EUPED|nr:unnamed protein product [Euphydryas editha]
MSMPSRVAVDNSIGLDACQLAAAVADPRLLRRDINPPSHRTRESVKPKLVRKYRKFLLMLIKLVVTNIFA